MEALREITVMITAAGNVFMPGTTACLTQNGERKVRLIGVDMNDDPSLLQMCDAYYPVPRGDDPGYVDALLAICEKEHVEVLLPVMSVELNALARNRGRFEAIGIKVSVSGAESLEIANDKRKLFDFLKQNGLPCADFRAVSSMESFGAAVRELGYPGKKVCVKTTNGSGSRGFRIIDETRPRYEMYLHEKPNSCMIRLSEMEAILAEADEFPELLVMEYLPGNEYTVDLLADQGKVLYCCCRKSLGMDHGIMLNSEVVRHNEIDGSIGFDILEREDGTPCLVECNPRMTAGIPVFRLAGVNLPYLNVKRLLGEALPDCNLELGKIVRRRWLEM